MRRGRGDRLSPRHVLAKMGSTLNQPLAGALLFNIDTSLTHHHPEGNSVQKEDFPFGVLQARCKDDPPNPFSQPKACSLIAFAPDLWLPTLEPYLANDHLKVDKIKVKDKHSPNR
jgi:hypothetical protein